MGLVWGTRNAELRAGGRIAAVVRGGAILARREPPIAGTHVP